ncbi:putative major facilitator superfamily transporter [Agrobacterium rubi TR3 = NBRC 13261]|uniref:Putative major facilitator superfamily transporter n=1 Tax=Agrobacterium rubi TR3 = NBRC 13261 TaxID=1368415 RepID=A0A081CQ94_9HYPH|nr:MFS transporter [Agrobacterium rubi]MBP1877357.1 MFS family permease [Agrobacterium rubi]GAK68840.1 putative major facilitator superfamily transporter [Agrobacterium rubi TR3 = NBRC 13261]
MSRNLLPVFALLSSTLFLFLGNGLQGLLLPVRGSAEGYSNEVLGFLGTSWAAGFVVGCFVAPAIVRRAGHIRAFGSFVALICLTILLTGLFIDDVSWVALRALTGFCTAGTSMIIESWLNERATNESRGAIFSLYIAITLFGVVAGQLVVPFGNVNTTTLFMVCAIIYCVAIMPAMLSKAESPQPLKKVKLDLPALYRNSPVSFVGILLIGIANGAYGTLGAVFGARAGLDPTTIAIMVSVTIFIGALAQFPAGKLSDRIDRRYVLAGLSGVAALAGLAVTLIQPGHVYVLIGMIAVYGATANAPYPIAVAHANDYASSEDFVKVSGGLLLLYGIGTIIGPTLGGPIMTSFGPYALFWVTAASHLLITAYAMFRSRQRAALPTEEKDNFSTTAMAQITPESASLDPRAPQYPEDEAELEKGAGI